MRTLFYTIALLLFAAITAGAQIPRTINYQGRAADAAGPITGTRQMTLRLYTSASGGTPLHVETQSVNFSSLGVFTVVIGGTATAPIPTTVTFDREYYLGVTITGFNSGGELVPRFRLRSSPYSFRAAIADSSAKIPSLIGGNLTRKGVGVLDIVNDKPNGAALRAEGSPYAIISDGIDSTSEHFITRAELGPTQPPDRGGLYRDNVPMAWGVINSDGSIASDFGIAGVLFDDTTRGYEITLDHPAKSIQRGALIVPDVAPSITIGGDLSTDVQFLIPTWSYKRDATGAIALQKIIVYFKNNDQFGTQSPFSIQVFGRAQ